LVFGLSPLSNQLHSLQVTKLNALAKSKVELSKALLRAAEKAKGTDNPGTGSDVPKKRKVTG
jgi:hypothetical protein